MKKSYVGKMTSSATSRKFMTRKVIKIPIKAVLLRFSFPVTPVNVLTLKYLSRSMNECFFYAHEPASPGARVGVGVPGLLLHPERRLRQDGTEPGRDVFADVVDLVRVLA